MKSVSKNLGYFYVELATFWLLEVKIIWQPQKQVLKMIEVMFAYINL